MVRHGISQGRLHGAQRAEAAHACPELWAKIPSKAQLLNAPPHCPSPVRSELFRQCYAVGAGVLVRENGCRGRGHRDPSRLCGLSVVGCGRCKVSRYYANAFLRPFVIHGAATAVKEFGCAMLHSLLTRTMTRTERVWQEVCDNQQPTQRGIRKRPDGGLLPMTRDDTSDSQFAGDGGGELRHIKEFQNAGDVHELDETAQIRVGGLRSDASSPFQRFIPPRHPRTTCIRYQ